MVKTITFISADKKYQYTVLESFFKNRYFYHDTESRLLTLEESIKRVSEEDVYNLMNQMHLNNYLHNDFGPAIVYLETNQVAYFKNGKPLSKEEGEKMQYDSEFSDYILKELGI